ncbi:MAG: flagellar export chaperone FliS [Rhodoferax sp.]
MFIPVHARAASAYKRVGVETIVSGADSHQLIQLLLNALLQTLDSARSQMLAGDVMAKCQSMSRAVHMLQDGLDGALDMEHGGEVAQRMRALYDYCSNRLALGNARNDVAMIDEVKGLLAPIAKAWEEIRPAELQKGAR